MALKIRLARAGRKKRPFYRIVVAEAKMPRDGRFIERLGSYDPLLSQDNPLRISLHKERITYWLSVGAKPSERVALFLGKADITPMPKQPERPKKAAPGKKAMERQKEKVEADKAKAEADKAKAEADKAKAEADKAKAEAENKQQETTDS